MNRVLKLASAGLIATGLPFAAFAQGGPSTAPATPDAKAGTPATVMAPSQDAKTVPAHEAKTAATHTTAATSHKPMKEQPKTPMHSQAQGTGAPATPAKAPAATASDGKS